MNNISFSTISKQQTLQSQYHLSCTFSIETQSSHFRSKTTVNRNFRRGIQLKILSCFGYQDLLTLRSFLDQTELDGEILSFLHSLLQMPQLPDSWLHHSELPTVTAKADVLDSQKKCRAIDQISRVALLGCITLHSGTYNTV